ncbi:MAG: hypothetical protein K9H61_01740 [Bacteroidia bacterium]|nr:hypothetical protein [Bacteroidia bacterium]MCF8425605.1 hypothetical protein [Bacteroidia bacterium]MCF8445692.1 hypothetical protein [Bacteroidia bacterium]
MKNTVLVGLLAIGMMASCKKDLIEKFNEDHATSQTTKVSSFNQIKASETFDWSTTKKVTLNVTGLKTMVPIKNTLKVTDVDGKTVYHSANLAMDESVNFQLDLPTSVAEVIINFGSISKKLSTTSGKIEFDYIVEVAE